MGLLQKAATGPGALILGGLLFWVLAWVIDLWTHVETFGIAEGAHAHGGSLMIRATLPVTGVPLLAFGVAQMMGTDTLMKRGGLPVYFASLLLALDGLAHAFAFNDHLGNLASASFFAFVAPLEVAAGVAFPFIARRHDSVMALGVFSLIAIYTVSRAAAFAPLGWPEPVEGLGVFSKLVEALFLLAVVGNARGIVRTPNPPAEEPAAPPEAAARGAGR